MFAGHIGAALALGRVDRRVNVGAIVGAAMLLDALLWVFVLIGWETAIIPADFAVRHQPQFEFPYSHGLAASFVWAALAGIVTFFWLPGPGRTRLLPAIVIGGAVISHWLLDALVHVPELPLLGSRSPRVGLGLWQDMPLALAVETAITAAGLALFVAGSSLARGRKIGIALLCAALAGFTIAGMTVAPPPPSITAMAVSSLVTIAIVTALAAWLGRGRKA